jgi:hypothetical protein
MDFLLDDLDAVVEAIFNKMANLLNLSCTPLIPRPFRACVAQLCLEPASRLAETR